MLLLPGICQYGTAAVIRGNHQAGPLHEEGTALAHQHGQRRQTGKLWSYLSPTQLLNGSVTSSCCDHCAITPKLSPEFKRKHVVTVQRNFVHIISFY
jgi:hypothetical protein